MSPGSAAATSCCRSRRRTVPAASGQRANRSTRIRARPRPPAVPRNRPRGSPGGARSRGEQVYQARGRPRADRSTRIRARPRPPAVPRNRRRDAAVAPGRGANRSTQLRRDLGKFRQGPGRPVAPPVLEVHQGVAVSGCLQLRHGRRRRAPAHRPGQVRLVLLEASGALDSSVRIMGAGDGPCPRRLAVPVSKAESGGRARGCQNEECRIISGIRVAWLYPGFTAPVDGKGRKERERETA